MSTESANPRNDDGSSEDQRASSETYPEWIQGPFPERSRFGTTTGEWYVRCKYCLRQAMTSDWRSIEHKADCKLPESVDAEQVEGGR